MLPRWEIREIFGKFVTGSRAIWPQGRYSSQMPSLNHFIVYTWCTPHIVLCRIRTSFTRSHDPSKTPFTNESTLKEIAKTSKSVYDSVEYNVPAPCANTNTTCGGTLAVDCLAACIAFTAQRANSSSRLLPMPAVSVTGIARRTNRRFRRGQERVSSTSGGCCCCFCCRFGFAWGA